MNHEKTYNGSCFCGAVQLTVSGQPEGMGYCHCESCRRWSAGPVNAFTLWKPEAVRITRGAENIGTYNKTPNSYRKWCKTCGGHVLTEHPGLGLTDVYAAAIPDFPYQAGVHVHYQETVLPIKDGLPKMKDLPAEMGGSGDPAGGIIQASRITAGLPGCSCELLAFSVRYCFCFGTARATRGWFSPARCLGLPLRPGAFRPKSLA